MIKVIFFDFDGVIVESVDIKTQAFATLFEHEGEETVKKVVEYHLKNTGVSRFEKFRYIHKEFLKRDLSDNEFNNLCNRFAGTVIDNIINAPYVKGAREFLEKYAGKYDFYIISATPQEEIEEILKRRDIFTLFKNIFGAPTKKSKAVKKTMEEKKYMPSEFLYVGDAISDYNAAKNNNIKFIARINGNEEIFKGIDCIKIKNLDELEGVVINI